MAKRAKRESVVKKGGVAREDSNAEDITRDTYGYSPPAPESKEKDERLGEADRAAAAAGIPGVMVPEPETESEAVPPEEQDNRVRHEDVSGDRVASRRDVEKLRSKPP